MKNEIFLSGEVGYDITLQKLIESWKELDENEKSVKLFINTAGGLIIEGKAIYKYLKKKQSEGWSISTEGFGTIASMGTIIFLAGDKDKRH